MERIGVAVVCLLAAGCAVPGGGAETRPAATATATSPAPAEATASGPDPTTTPSTRAAPARVRLSQALAGLRTGDPRPYGVLLSDSGATVLEARGRWDAGEGAAAFSLLISQPLRPGQRFGGPVVAVGGDRYLRRSDSCWERLEAAQLNGRLGITDATLGLTGVSVLSRATLKGESLASRDVLRLAFELTDVLRLFGATVPQSGPRGAVEGEIEILDGEVTEWSISGSALADALPPGVPDRARNRVEGLSYSVAYGPEVTEPVRRPPADKVAPGPGLACRDGEDREV